MGAQRGVRGMVLPMIQPGVEWGWAISAILRPLYPREGTTLPVVEEGWVGFGACLDECRKEGNTLFQQASNPGYSSLL